VEGEGGRGRKNTSLKADAYRAFFQPLMDELRTKYAFAKVQKAQPQGWYAFNSGTSGVPYAVCFGQHQRARADVYIDQGESI
jgi:hypothetical protein